VAERRKEGQGRKSEVKKRRAGDGGGVWTQSHTFQFPDHGSYGEYMT